MTKVYMSVSHGENQLHRAIIVAYMLYFAANSDFDIQFEVVFKKWQTYLTAQ